MPIYKKVSASLTLLKDYRAESTCRASSHFRNEVLIGVGANIGDVNRRFAHLKVFLQRDRRLNVEKISSVLKNPPFGFLEQEDFHNLVIKVSTNMQAKTFMQFLLRSEKKFQRVRSFQDAPRTLDLDMIFFNNVSMKTEFLTLPHPHYQDRDSVVIPLKQIKEYR